MSYKRTTLVSRHGYSASGGLWDSIKGVAGKGWDIVSGGEKAKGQAELLTAQQKAAQQQAGAMPTWLLPVGIAGVALFLYTRRKK